jgi:hypothetical protein
VSGRGLAGALERTLAVKSLDAGVVVMPDVPSVKVVGLARYGLGATAPALRELGERRRTATLLAAVRQLEVDAVDDALDLFDLLMATKLPREGREARQQGEAEDAADTAPRGGEDRGCGRRCCWRSRRRAASR